MKKAEREPAATAIAAADPRPTAKALLADLTLPERRAALLGEVAKRSALQKRYNELIPTWRELVLLKSHGALGGREDLSKLEALQCELGQIQCSLDEIARAESALVRIVPDEFASKRTALEAAAAALHAGSTKTNFNIGVRFGVGEFRGSNGQAEMNVIVQVFRAAAVKFSALASSASWAQLEVAALTPWSELIFGGAGRG